MDTEAHDIGARAREGRIRRIRIPWGRVLKWSAIGLVGILLLIQLVPYGRDHSNPPVTNAVAWDSPRTEQLARDACLDCHSNETDWPWYSNIAPASWWVQDHVNEGRSELNYSEPGGMEEASESAETVQDGSMPPWYYEITHPEARLSDQEKQDLIDGFIATFGSEEHEGGEDEDDD